MPICILFHTSFACCSLMSPRLSSEYNSGYLVGRPWAKENKWPPPQASPDPRLSCPSAPVGESPPACLLNEGWKNLDSHAPTAFGIQEGALGQAVKGMRSPEDAGKPWHFLSSLVCPGMASWWPCPIVPGSQPLCLVITCPLTVLKVSPPLAWLQGLISVLPPPVPFPCPHPTSCAQAIDCWL